MIGKLIGSGQLGKLASFAWPAFFEIMPARSLRAKVRHLYGHSRDSEAVRRAVAGRVVASSRGSVPQLRFDPEVEPTYRACPTGDDDARDRCVIEPYFEPGPGDEQRFRQGLHALSLDHGQDVFRTHFADATTRFSTRQFVETFHRVFVRCKQAGTALHPDALSFGIYRAAPCDPRGAAVDVREVFARANGVPLADFAVVHV